MNDDSDLQVEQVLAILQTKRAGEEKEEENVRAVA
jgi:hypothetical protein